MAMNSTNGPLAAVRAAYPAWVADASIEPLGNRGGFSGARIYRLSCQRGVFCLRGGTPGENASRVASRHALLHGARADGLAFVPGIVPTRSGTTVVEHGGRCWELMQWMPGRADFHAAPSTARLQAAVEALARLHLAWGRHALPGVAECPGVRRRLDAVQGLPRIDPFADRLQRELAFWLPQVSVFLARMPHVGLQPVLRDIWHDHLLYEGDTLAGLVDYASIDLDSVAIDLARMLGSLIEDDEGSWQFALSAYRRLCPLSADEERLARALDRAGVVAALANWHRWIATGERDPASPHVRARVERLLARVGRWPRGVFG
jgi:Ser/Thr protein kinase RdoA (MazF antagonist)